MEEIAAALAQLVQGKTPLLLKAPPERPRWEGREERGREGRTASPRHAHASGQPGGSTAPGRGPDSRFRGNDERGQDRERAQHRPGPRPEPRPHETNAPRPPANAAEAMFFDDDAPRREHTPRPPRGGEEFPMETFRIEVGRSEEHTSELQSLMRLSYAR